MIKNGRKTSNRLPPFVRTVGKSIRCWPYSAATRITSRARVVVRHPKVNSGYLTVVGAYEIRNLKHRQMPTAGYRLRLACARLSLAVLHRHTQHWFEKPLGMWLELCQLASLKIASRLSGVVGSMQRSLINSTLLAYPLCWVLAGLPEDQEVPYPFHTTVLDS